MVKLIQIIIFIKIQEFIFPKIIILLFKLFNFVDGFELYENIIRSLKVVIAYLPIEIIQFAKNIKYFNKQFPRQFI